MSTHLNAVLSLTALLQRPSKIQIRIYKIKEAFNVFEGRSRSSISISRQARFHAVKEASRFWPHRLITNWTSDLRSADEGTFLSVHPDICPQAPGSALRH